MKLNKLLILSIILIFFLTVVTVSANDNNQTDFSISNEITIPEDTVIEENLEETNNENIVQSANETDEREEPQIDIHVPEKTTRSQGITASFRVYPAFNANGDKNTYDMNIYHDNELIMETQIGDYSEVPIDIEDWVLGTHTLKFAYLGDENNKAFNRTFDFELTDVGIYISDIMHRGETIFIVMPKDATGNVTIRINETITPYNVENAREYSTYKGISQDIPYTMEYGNYDVEITYSGNYGEITKRMNVTIDLDLEFKTLADDLTHYIQNAEFLFFDSPTGNVTVLIDGKDIHYDPTHKKPGSISRDENFFDGEIYPYAPIWLNEIPLSRGYHTIELWATDENRTSSIKEVFYMKIPRNWGNSRTIYTKPQLVNSICPIEFIFDEKTSENVSIYLRMDYGDYKLIECTTIADHAVITNINCSETGTYEIKAVLDENETYEEITTEFKVVPAILNYTDLGDRIHALNSDTSYRFTLQTGENVTGTFSINFVYNLFNRSIFKTVEINTNSTEITVPGTAFTNVGSYGIIAEWDTNYGTWSEHANDVFVVDYTSISYCSENGYNKNIPEQGSIIMSYNDNVPYSVQVISENGKPVEKNKIVTFKIGKNKFNVRTNSKGIATLKIDNSIKPGKYIVTATYKGVLKTVTYSKNLTVKQVLTLKTVTVKKSAKKLVLTATLKKNKKALKNKKVTFKFNGKTFKTKTNNKGIAKITVKKSILKKLKVGKKVTYQVTYIKDTVKKTAKVKR